MVEKRLPFYNRILFKLLLPVIFIGILCATLLVGYMSSPLKKFLIQQFDANLRLSSIMGLRVCEESFNYLLELRLENNSEMNLVMKNETMDKIKTIGGQFPRIHLMIIKSGQFIEASTLEASPDTWEGPPIEGQDDTLVAFTFNGQAARAHVQFFPFWEWQVVSFVFEKDYNSPIRLVYKITYLSAIGVFFAMLITVLMVFHLYIKKPLNQLIASTDGVAEGRLFKIDRITHNEFGRLMVSFNAMIDSLENEKAAVRNLIHQLRESEALFRSQFEFGDIGIAILNPDKRTWVRANERLCRMLGYTEKELHKTAWFDLFIEQGPENKNDNFNRMLAGEIHSYENELRLFHKKGDAVYTHLNVSCIQNEDKTIKLVIISLVDITDRKIAELEKEELSTQLLQVQKMEAIGTLAGGIAHDFNNILTGIFGYSQLAVTHMNEPEKARADIKKIVKGASRAADLVQQILTFGRKADHKKQTIGLCVIVKEVLKLIRSTIPTTIEIKETINSQAGILANPIQMHQVIMNLCTNAYHAMSDSGGTLTVRLDEVSGTVLNKMPHIKTDKSRYLELEIRDTGQGMNETIMEKIFEPYFTTKTREKGTGLGLALVHAIVEEHEGFVKVSSKLGQGSTFLIYFPIVETQHKIEKIDKPSGRMPSGTETIMFVEDEENIRSFNQIFLEKHGYRVSVFENGAEAYKIYEQEPHKFDLVITDMAMPKMNGQELAVKILKIRKDIPIILCTGFSENLNEDQAKEMGISRYIQKPVDAKSMCRLVREVLDNRH